MKIDSYNLLSDNSQLELVFFSAFGKLLLLTAGTKESNGIYKVYEPSPVPTLYD